MKQQGMPGPSTEVLQPSNTLTCKNCISAALDAWPGHKGPSVQKTNELIYEAYLTGLGPQCGHIRYS